MSSIPVAFNCTECAAALTLELGGKELPPPVKCKCGAIYEAYIAGEVASIRQVANKPASRKPKSSKQESS